MKIDAHQHFWKLERGDYGWLSPDLAPLYRDFQPADLEPLLEDAGMDGTILVQAAPTRAETQYLLDLANRHAFIKGVVGWADFEAATAAEDIATLADHPRLVGLRPMIQDIADDSWMLDPRLTPAFRAVIDNDLTFDALIFPRHVRNLLRLAERHPDLRLVIDHGAKPQIRDRDFDSWSGEIDLLARETPAFCKLSGLVTEASDSWTPDDIAPYAHHLLNAFGPERVIWGSDWPVCTLASGYRQWLDLAKALVGPDTEAQTAVFGQTAFKAYRLWDRPARTT